MISVKEAVQAAVAAAQAFYTGQELSGLQLEEVEMSEDGKLWLITLGFFLPVPPRDAFEKLMSPKSDRRFKLFKIEADTGKVLAMKIRQA
jgi:hypothetical protein